MSVLKQVEEFHKSFGHPVKDTPNIPSDRVELRVSLILEELHELAVASGKEATFVNLMMKKLLQIKGSMNNTDNGDIVECADAFADLLYVLYGAIHEYGLGGKIEAVSNNVHASNMSKLCNSIEQANRTVSKYASEGVDTYYAEVGEGLYAIYRTEDNKILKSVDYTPASLRDIVLGDSVNSVEGGN